MGYERLFSKVSEDELAKLCAELIRFDTTNPPGNERAAAEWVAHYLEDLGFEAEFVPHGESRTTLVAHLKGSGEVPPVEGGLQYAGQDYRQNNPRVQAKKDIQALCVG